MREVERGREVENEEDPNDRGSLFVLTSMNKGGIVEYMWSLMSKDHKDGSEIKYVKGFVKDHKNYQKSKISKDHKSDGLEIKGLKDQRSYEPNGINDISMTLVAIAHIFTHTEE